MLKCKCCKTSDLGVTLIEIKKTPVKMVNGEAVGILADPIIEQKYEVNYCFTCKKDITQDDLYENETCPVCGKEVEELVNGVCPECDAEKNKLLNMSKEDLILMLMQQAKSGAVAQSQQESKTEEIKEDTANKEAKKKTTRAKAKAEPKEVIKEEVETAQTQVEESVKNVDMPDSVGVAQNADDLSQVPANNVETTVPALTDETDDILKQLDDINVDSLGIQSEQEIDAGMPF